MIQITIVEPSANVFIVAFGLFNWMLEDVIRFVVWPFILANCC
jgi:hypothetical protein